MGKGREDYTIEMRQARNLRVKAVHIYKEYKDKQDSRKRVSINEH